MQGRLSPQSGGRTPPPSFRRLLLPAPPFLLVPPCLKSRPPKYSYVSGPHRWSQAFAGRRGFSLRDTWPLGRESWRTARYDVSTLQYLCEACRHVASCQRDDTISSAWWLTSVPSGWLLLTMMNVVHAESDVDRRTPSSRIAARPASCSLLWAYFVCSIRWFIKLWDITSLGSVHCASRGILWFRRTPLCRRWTNRTVSGHC